MPAYRSSAEAEIRDAVVAKLRRDRPGARIIHEINIDGGATRVDVMAVDRLELITVEVKSERDKLDRLPDQLAAMRSASHVAVAALHRKFMPPIDDLARPRLDGVPYGVPIWWHPAAQDMVEAHHPAFQWAEIDRARSLGRALPPDALRILWRAELVELAGQFGIACRCLDMGGIRNALRWAATGRDLTRGICRALRLRTGCAEADATIAEDAA
ncbi:hypothetical protein N0B44_15665 [Roseibacterium beibuensis]|uniref:Uncharacterized protein n=1 Tax=[Roseibacterium] beibuensis TaxID=1193142 RepID=A0ABP9LA06_9RHOB|nr:hypothetical protein [Roseibacterium beibuensis]MCS6624356.1 hypothetical protein [Roseibacterium beibuensis]